MKTFISCSLGVCLLLAGISWAVDEKPPAVSKAPGEQKNARITGSGTAGPGRESTPKEAAHFPAAAKAAGEQKGTRITGSGTAGPGRESTREGAIRFPGTPKTSIKSQPFQARNETSDVAGGSITNLLVNQGKCDGTQSFQVGTVITILADFNCSISADDTNLYCFHLSLKSQYLGVNPPSTDIDTEQDQDLKGNGQQQVNKTFTPSAQYKSMATQKGNHRVTATLIVSDLTTQPPPPPVTLATLTCVYAIQ